MNEAKPTVGEAWSNVMASVQGIAKRDRNTAQNFNFRGIDAVVNAVGPEARREGIITVPLDAHIVADVEYTTSKGTRMRDVTIAVLFRVYGPAGDYFEGMALGEAADSGDKAIPKAHSVAYRTFLLQSLCIPTDEPDPDSESHERKAEELADEANHAVTDLRARMEEYAALHGLDISRKTDSQAKAMLNDHAKKQKAAK